MEIKRKDVSYSQSIEDKQLNKLNKQNYRYLYMWSYLKIRFWKEYLKPVNSYCTIITSVVCVSVKEHVRTLKNRQGIQYKSHKVHVVKL